MSTKIAELCKDIPSFTLTFLCLPPVRPCVYECLHFHLGDAQKTAIGYMRVWSFYLLLGCSFDRRWGGVARTVRIAHSHHVLHFIIFHSLYDCLACTHIHKHAVDHLCFCVCIRFWNLFSLCTIIADIACTFCCYSFHISYTHNTWFHLNHFLANCDEVIPIATGPASYCMRMRMWRQNPLNGRTICPKHCAINVILFIFIQTFQSSSLFLFSLSHPCHCM